MIHDDKELDKLLDDYGVNNDPDINKAIVEGVARDYAEHCNCLIREHIARLEVMLRDGQ